MRTRAERDGDEWVVSGQKVWTSFGIHADWVYVLTRTDPQSARHKGLSMLLVPTDQPGVEIRPIRNLAYQDEFAEIFLSDARTGADMVVGEVGQGWRTAMATLGIERGTTLLPQQLAFEREAEALIDLARERGALDDPMLRRRIVDAWISVRIMRTTNLRTIAELTALPHAGRPGHHREAVRVDPAPATRPAGHGACGPAGQIVGEDYALDRRQRSFLLALAETIYGGSSEIQRNIIGEQVLGLPKEPRP